MMRNFLVIFIWIIICTGVCLAQTSESAFTFQGKLNDGGFAANGNYDMAFRLFDAPGGTGTQIGSTVTINNVPVSNGIFSVELDFGHTPFVTLLSRFLEIGIRRTGTTDPLTVLSPRQKITGSPFASQSFNATLAVNANVANFSRGLICSDECVQSDEIESVAGGKVIGAVRRADEAATVADGAGGGIVNILSINGFVSTIAGGSSDFSFYGNTVNITVPSGTSKVIAGSVTTTLSTSGGTTSITYGLCFQGSGNSVSIFRNASLTRSITSTRSPLSYSGSVSVAGPATYTVGFCVQNSGSTINQSSEQITGYIIAPK